MYFEIVVFTASGKEYADAVINSLVDIKPFISHRLYWNHVTLVHSDLGVAYVKDISKLGRPLDSVFIVDDQPQNFSSHPERGLHISEWRGDPSDRELERVGLEVLNRLIE